MHLKDLFAKMAGTGASSLAVLPGTATKCSLRRRFGCGGSKTMASRVAGFDPGAGVTALAS
jgi:hypothetical protein